MIPALSLTGLMLVHAGSCVSLGVPFFFPKSLFLMVLVLIKRLFQTVYSVVLVVYSHPVDYLPGQIHVIKARIE